MDKAILAKTLSEATINRNLEKLEEISGITPKKKKLVYGEKDVGDLNYLICQVIVAVTAEIHDKACKPSEKNKIQL